LLTLKKGHISAFSSGPYGQKFMHRDSTNVLFIKMEMHGQLDINKYEYFNGHMVVVGRWLRPNTELLSTCVS